jgi:phosphoesterase RecJ-like protein
MGSSLGLYHYLLSRKHTVTVVTPNDYPQFLNFLPGNDKVIDFQKNTKGAKAAIAKAEMIFCLDFNSLKRIDVLGELVAKTKAIKVIIDHHQKPDTFADYLVHNVKASSTCELVYKFINENDDAKLITKKVAICLYTGIMTDTGSFAFSSTTQYTHTVASALIAAGAENEKIHQAIYNDSTEDRLRLLGYCLTEKLTVLKEYNTAFFSLRADELKRFNHKKGDTEGVVNYALSMKEIEFAAFFVERDGGVKSSFRSKSDFDVNQFARKHFNGGGHQHAAGGNSDVTLDEVVLQFIAVLPEYKKELNKKK